MFLPLSQKDPSQNRGDKCCGFSLFPSYFTPRTPYIFYRYQTNSRHLPRTNLSQQVAQEVRKHFGDIVIPTEIPRAVRVSEAPSFQQTVITYDPGSPGAQAYVKVAKEFALRHASVN